MKMSGKPSLESIYSEALRRADGEDRLAFVRGACGDDEALRSQVEALLGTHDDSARLGRCIATEALATNPSEAGERPGDRVGAYTLMKRVGEGAFGVVFAADQSEPVRRRVALKILKPGMDARQITLRFQLERHMLGLMDHPHIARVLDAGTTAHGRPFFVMEFVQGNPITRYCEGHRLPVRERMRLFTKVCRAVHHAHQKGVIHRDLKPSNILVEHAGGEAAPKVIDFGIAKAIEQKLTDETIRTIWHQCLGTPAYMSPEQTRLGEIDIDTRTDVYSLGAVLYELLVGLTPVELPVRAGLDDWRQRIREAPIVKPSTRLARLAAGRLAEVARNRDAEPRALEKMIRGDLDWIVLKATEKNREHRYASAEALARDLERFLEDRPIEARAPSRSDQLMKFVKRNRVLAGAGAAVLIALLGGTAAATWGAWVARKESQIARAEEHKARESIDLLFRAFVRVVPSEGGNPNYSVRDMLDHLTEMTEGGELQSKEVECAVRDMLSFFYNEFAEFELAGRHARIGLERTQQIGGDPRLEAKFHTRLGQVLKEVGQRRDALHHLAQALEIHQRLDGNQHPNSIRLMLLVARVRQQLGDGPAGAAMAEQALQWARPRRGQAGNDDQLIRCLHMLALIYQHEGRYQDQEPLIAERLELVRGRNGDRHPETLHALCDFGTLRFHQGKFLESDQLLSLALDGQRQLLGDDYPQTLETMVALAQLREARDQPEEAAKLFEEALSRSHRSMGPHSPYRIRWLELAGAFFQRIGNQSRAAALARERAQAKTPSQQ